VPGTALLLTMFFLILLLLWMTFTAPPAYGQQFLPPTAGAWQLTPP